MDLTQWMLVCCVVAYTLTAAVLDVHARKIPNWLTVSALALALLFHTATGGLAGLGSAVGGFATGFGILLVLWLIGGGGGGDVKLMGALGAWLGAKLTLYVFVLSTLLAVAGSMLMLGLLVVQNGVTNVIRRHASRPAGGQLAIATSQAQGKQLMKRRLMPYALPVALGTWLVLAWQVFVQHQG